jgi:Cytochrome P460
MTTRKMAMIAGPIAAAAILAAAVEVRAGADKIAFPENYAKGVVYMQIDRAQNKQLTEYYVSPEAIAAAKSGMPLPSGTTIIAVGFAAQLDAQGNPVKDAKGNFVKTGSPTGYRVMEKRAGWGTDYPEDKRNGEWEYQVFRADKSINPTADLNGCFGCHKPQAKQDFVFTYDKLKAASL